MSAAEASGLTLPTPDFVTCAVLLLESGRLAVGYNPRDMSDNELAIDDRLGKGFTLRLRFSIESALARWLDPPWPLER